MQKHVVCLGSCGLLLLKEVQKHVVCLGPRGLLLLKEVLDCLERAHCLGYLYDGSFQLQDFRCGMEKNSQKSYSNDLIQVMKLIVNPFLRHELPMGMPAYPMYVLSLVELIEHMSLEEQSFS